MFASCPRCSQQNYNTATQCAYCGAPLASQVRASLGIKVRDGEAGDWASKPREMKMKTTGYALKQAIKQQELRKDTAANMFNGSLKAFPDEKKDPPQRVIAQFLTAETAVAKLQVAQMRYNLAVQVNAAGEKMTLAEAIKRVGGEARTEKYWRTAAGLTNDRHSRYGADDERDPTKVVSVATITPQESVASAVQAAKRAGALRAAIAVGNTEVVEIEDLNPALFE